MKTLIFSIVITLLFSTQFFSQQNPERGFKGYQNPNKLISLSSNISFSQAIKLISKVSEKVTGKKIISTVQIDSATGIELNRMNYFQAMVILVKMANLVYEVKPDAIIIKKPALSKKEMKGNNYVSVNAREVKISAVFFESDVNKAKERGIDWQTIFSSQGLKFGGQLGILPQTTTGNGTQVTGTTGGTSSNGTTSNNTQQQSPSFKIGGSASYSLGGLFGKAIAIFKLFESENIGQIISNPSITVLNGTEARLQDGQDLAIKQRDFSGNILEKFYSIGSIITVTPHVFHEDGINYILLNIHVERSSFVPNPNNTIINKTSANTRVVLLNGEETVIGGMFINQNTVIRTGVPILKDLPWWFFGLRYIFGSNQTNVIKKELVILIKATLVPTLKERLAGPQLKNPIRDQIRKYQNDIKYYHFNQSNSNKN